VIRAFVYRGLEQLVIGGSFGRFVCLGGIQTRIARAEVRDLRSLHVQLHQQTPELSMTDWDPEAFTRTMIEDMRANGGEVTKGPMAGEPLLVLTTTGAKSGQARTAIVKFTRDGDAYCVAGSKSGAPTDPSWYANLRANPDVQVEADGRIFNARATVAQGSDRDRLWARHVEALPGFGEYLAKTEGRVIPMIRLTPADHGRPINVR
jgi:deazaflavin-dependent oxidoreductase (nitroreductase family)